jgi:Protein of unknown function (DUF2800)
MASAAAEAGSVSVADAPKPTGHSRFGASKAERWMNCTASVVAEEGREDVKTKWAMIGTACHSVAALCLENNQDAEEYAGRIVDEIEIDEGMVENIQFYLDVIRADKAARGGRLNIERRFHLDWLHEEFFGTSDCSRFGTDYILSVYDAKFGHKLVRVFEEIDAGDWDNPEAKKIVPNRQLGYYAIGAIGTLPTSLTKNIKKVELIIVQPNAVLEADRVQRVLIDLSTLEELAQDLVKAADEALGPNAKFMPGHWCDYCKAAPVCKALRDTAMSIAQLEFDDEDGVVKDHGEKTLNPLHMTNEQIAHALDAADILEAFINAVRVHANLLSNRGEEFPGYKRVKQRSRRQWSNEDTIANDLMLDFGLDENSIYRKKLVSPAQAEKLVEKEDRDALKSYYFKPETGTTLVRESSSAQAVPDSAQSDFDD